MKKLPIFCLFFLLSTVSRSQDYPTNYFIAPLDSPLILTGNFGEIRPDHFHSGLDFGTGGAEGLPVMAAADGYVSRIKVAPDGFGKTVYITHPNGFVTVYAHLQKFNSALNAYVRKLQYERQTFEMDVKLKAKEFKVKQREVIAYSGNSGGSEAPHLHFEIRDEITEEPINPLLFGIKVEDHIAPKLRYVRIYPLLQNGIVNKTDSAVSYEVAEVEGILTLNTLDVIQAYGIIYFGFEAMDQVDGSENELGIYSAEVYLDGNLIYNYKYDRFNFNENVYLNAHTDYLTTKRDRMKYQRGHRLPGNHMVSLYSDTNVTGFVQLTEDASHDVKIIIRDFAGNASKMEFPVVTYQTLNENKYQPKPDNSILITNEKGIAIHKSKLDVVIPNNCVFQDMYYYDSEAKSENYLSSIYRIGNEYEAVSTPISIGIVPDAVADSLKSKLVIVRLNLDGTQKSIGGTFDGKLLAAKSKSFGTYAVGIDTVAPQITKDYFPADNNGYYGLVVRFKVKDELSDISVYSGTIEGKWILFEYDKKSNILSADISWLETNKEHEVEIRATDERGNLRIYKDKFYY